MLSHANMVAHTLNAHEGWGFDPGDKNMVAMPLFHVGGSSYVLFGIHDGVPSVMTRDPDGASLAGAIMAGANRTFLVPAVLAQVLQSGDDAIRLFGRLKTYCYGASPMPMPLLRAAMQAWPDTDFIQVYGLTEVGGVITHLMPEAHRDADHPERLVSAGQPIPGAEVRVVDPGTLEDVPDRRARRAVVPYAAADEGLPRQAGGDRRGDHRRRLVPHRRPRQGRRGRLRLRRGPAQGHDHQRRRERLQPRGRAGARRAPGGHGGRGHRRPRRHLGRVGQGGRVAQAGHLGDRGGDHRVLPASTSPTSSARRPSTSSRRCPATPPARSSRATCAGRTGRVATARPSDPRASRHPGACELPRDAASMRNSAERGDSNRRSGNSTSREGRRVARSREQGGVATGPAPPRRAGRVAPPRRSAAHARVSCRRR